MPPEPIVPSEAVAAVADPRVRRHFSGGDVVPVAPAAPGGDAADGDGSDGGVMAVAAAPPAAHVARRGGASSLLGEDGGATAREARQCAEMRHALSSVQVDMERVGREVARLRVREATLEAALRSEGFVHAPGAAWEHRGRPYEHIMT